jgi:hypothetical protein
MSKRIANAPPTEDNHKLLPDQTILPREDEGATTPPSAGPTPAGEKPPPPAPPTDDLLSAAKRARDYKREGAANSRQLDIALKGTPPTGILIRTWPNPADDYDVAILRVKTDNDRKETYILDDAVASLPYVGPKVRNGRLVACVTHTGLVFVWACTEADPGDRLCYRMYRALEDFREAARERWVGLSWDTGSMVIEEPRVPIADEPRWPTGQTLREIYSLAIRGAFIGNSDHPVVKKLDVVTREV